MTNDNETGKNDTPDYQSTNPNIIPPETHTNSTLNVNTTNSENNAPTEIMENIAPTAPSDPTENIAPTANKAHTANPVPNAPIGINENTVNNSTNENNQNYNTSTNNMSTDYPVGNSHNSADYSNTSASFNDNTANFTPGYQAPNFNQQHNYNGNSYQPYQQSHYQQEPVPQSNGNWPSFMVDDRSQIFFGILSLILSFVSGFGIIPAAYYLWYLDKSTPKNTFAKWLNIAAVAIPIIGIIFYVLFFAIFMSIGFLAV